MCGRGLGNEGRHDGVEEAALYVYSRQTHASMQSVPDPDLHSPMALISQSLLPIAVQDRIVEKVTRILVLFAVRYWTLFP